MECVLAAHGGGAVAISRHTHRIILNVDVGGGTTKFALVDNGQIVGTWAVAAGGRLVVRDQGGNVTRAVEPARQVARALGIELRLGAALPDAEHVRLAETLGEILMSMIEGTAHPLRGAEVGVAYRVR